VGISPKIVAYLIAQFRLKI